MTDSATKPMRRAAAHRCRLETQAAATSDKSTPLERANDDDRGRDAGLTAARRINVSGAAVVGQLDNERPSSPTYATAKPRCDSDAARAPSDPELAGAAF